LKSKGIPGNVLGDLYVVLGIVLPPANTESEQEAYRVMAKAFNFDARAEMNHMAGGAR
jgi:curved DNA-binding protein